MSTDELPSPPLRRSGRLLRNNTSKISYAESLEVLYVSTESEPDGSVDEGSEEEVDTTEAEGSVDGEEGVDALVQGKIDQKGDGTNSTLNTLSEVDIIKVKENRRLRERAPPDDIHVLYNHERYMLAGKRVKYKSSKAELPAKSESRKAKKPRKGNLTGRSPTDNLPEKPISNFSVSAEIARLKLEQQTDSNIPVKHNDEINFLIDDIGKDFPRWQYILRERFNIALYGYGSKEPILHNFKLFLKDEFTVLDINGLFPKLNPRKILLAFWEALDGIDEPLPPSGANILAMADDMCQILNSTKHPSIYFIIHGLDRLAIRQPKFFKALCVLSQVEFIHLVVSVDHINAGLGIRYSAIVDLNLYWINCTTFAKYDEELSWDGEDLTDFQEEAASKSSLHQVLKSLTANARKAFKILVTLQLDSMKSLGESSYKKFSGVQFSELSRKCREAFVAHGEMPLRTLLTEFVDHKLVRYAGKGKKSDNLLIVDLEMDVLEEVSKA